VAYVPFAQWRRSQLVQFYRVQRMYQFCSGYVQILGVLARTNYVRVTLKIAYLPEITQLACGELLEIQSCHHCTLNSTEKVILEIAQYISKWECHIEQYV
jgi:hypothetical protein